MSIDIHGLSMAAQIAYRDVLTGALGYYLPNVETAEELIALAKSVDVKPLEAERGWRSEPPFPGAGEIPERTPAGWRMICACRLFAGTEEFGVLFFTLFGGRATSMFVNDPGSVIPEVYTAFK